MHVCLIWTLTMNVLKHGLKPLGNIIKSTLFFTNKLINIDIWTPNIICTCVGSNHVKSMIIYSQPGYFFK